MLYFVPISKALETSTLIKTALCAASTAKSSYRGYNRWHGPHVGDVKNITAQEFSASLSIVSRLTCDFASLTLKARCCCVGGTCTASLIPNSPPFLPCLRLTISSICGRMTLPRGVSRTVCGSVVMWSGIPWPSKKVAKSLEKLLQL